MAFELRINFTDIIQKNSLKNTYFNGHVNGYQFRVRLSYYRGLYLSCIDKLQVHVDNELIKDEDIMFRIHKKDFTVAQLPYLISEFWNILEEAEIEIHKPGGLPAGEHKIDLTLMLRSPYLPMPGSDKEHDYAPINSCDSAILMISGGSKDE